MSVFDGIGAVVNATFGAAVTITRAATGTPVTVRAVFRFMLVDDPTADGRGLNHQMPVLRIPANLLPALVRGDTVQPSEYAGKSFRVLQADTSGAAAADRMITYVCEEI